MEEKKNQKEFYIIIGILVVLVIVLIILVGILLLKGENEKQRGTGNAGPFVEEGNSDLLQATDTSAATEDADRKGITAQSTDRENGTVIITNGYKLIIPCDYLCTYVDGVGPVIYMDGGFQMKLVVRENSYDESVKHPESLTAPAIQAGGTILQEVKETELDGRKYTYFIAELMGDTTFVVQTGIEDNRLAAQIVVQSDALTDDDLLNIFANIIKTAMKTDEPDSTMEDIMGQLVVANYGEVKAESSLTFDGETVTYQVPEGFYSNGFYESDVYCTENFLTADFVSVDCYLWSTKVEGYSYSTAKDYIEGQLDWMLDNVKDETAVQTVEADGRTIYYIDVHYEFDGTDTQKVYAACDYNQNGIYIVKLTALDVLEEQSIDVIKEFFNLK